MSRLIASVHVDIARFLIEIQDVQASGGDKELADWVRNLSRSLALNDATISHYGAMLLGDAQKYRDAEKERKRANPPADSGGKTRKSGDSTQRKKGSKKENSSAARERDPIFDTIQDLFFPEGVMPGQGSRIGKIVRELKSISATPEQIRTRTENMRRLDWGRTAGPEGLLKQWGNLRGNEKPPMSEFERSLKTGTIAGSYPLDQEDYTA